jgi:hypothetical protein
MSRLEPADHIERIVGVPRPTVVEVARAVSDEQRVYILHSRTRVDQTPDLRDCPLSRALDLGIDLDSWSGWEDKPVSVQVGPDGRLVPVGVWSPDAVR